MASPKRCPRCDAPIEENSPGGLCPRCLMALNLNPDTGSADAGARISTPTPQELAPHFPQLEIIEFLGRGGMGAVYKARQRQLDRFVALKILAHEKEGDPKFNERFTREAQLLARLNHPNIVTVYDFGIAGGYFYLLMEYVDGLNLRQLLQAGTMTPPQALGIVPLICEALQFAHDQGIVHRDIKPENILLDKKGLVKIADFGIAKILSGQSKPGTLTQQAILGTPYYMAPEQVERPQLVDHRADIYSLGVVFYEMLTGELPMGRFIPPSQKVQVDVRLDEVVLRSLEKELTRRYQQASQVKSDVETIAGTPGGVPPSGVRPGVPSPSRPNPPANPPAAIKVFGVLKIIFAVLAFLMFPFYILKVLPSTTQTYGGQSLMMGWMVVTVIAQLPLVGIGLTSGIGLCNYKAWARKLAVYTSMFFSCPMLLIGLPIVLGSELTNTVMTDAQKAGVIFVTIIWTALWLAYHGLLIFYLTGKSVKEALGEIDSSEKEVGSMWWWVIVPSIIAVIVGVLIALCVSASGVPAPANASAGISPNVWQHPLPTVEQVIALYKKSVGGDAADQIKTVRMTSSSRRGSKIGGTSLVIASGPDRLYTRETVPEASEATTWIVNGDRGWTTTDGASGGPLTGEDLELVRSTNPLIELQDWRKHYDKVEVTGVEEVKGRKAYVVKLTTTRIPSVIFHYVAADTGHILQARASWPSRDGPVPFTIHYGDYRTVGGVSFPHQFIWENPAAGRIVYDIQKIEINVEVPDSIFTW